MIEDKKGFQTILKRYIEERNNVTLGELNQLAEDNGHKQSYMEREMRHICKEGYIEPILSHKKHIIGYEVVKSQKTSGIAQISPSFDPKKPISMADLKKKKELDKIESMRNNKGRVVVKF